MHSNRSANYRRYLSSAAIAALLAVPVAQPAQAQSINPVVDVCTGLSLDQSLVTGVVGEVVAPAVAPIQSSFNGLLDLTVNAGPVDVLAPLDVDLAQILANAATGAPLAVQALDTDGNIVSPGDCNISVDGVALNTPAGIAIGGNAITGLGAADQQATAAELDAIAFGNNASTGLGATGAVAIGSGASVLAANGVALGNGAIEDRGELTGYVAPGMAAPVSSVGAVSFGAAGAERQLTNIAPGSAATDATNLGQVQGLIAAAATPLAVQYDSGALDTVTLDGAGGTLVTNLAPGALTPTSTDAVNGAQLAATNLRVAQNASAIAAIDPTAGNAVSYDDPTLGTVTLGGATGTVVTNLADGAIEAGSSDAVNGSQLFATNQQLAANGAAIAGNVAEIAVLDARLDNVPVGYVSDSDVTAASAVPTDTAAFAGASGGAVRVTNIAAGTLATGSTDAVNGGQLAATNAQVAANRTDIDRNTADITTISNNLAGSTVAVVQYSDPATPTASNGGQITNDATLVGADAAAPVALHNIANGTLANDAVNLGQLQGGLTAAMADARTYTDGRFATLSSGLAQVEFDLEELREDAFSGTASAMALAGIPQTMDAGRAMVGGAVGHYRGQTAFALGASTTFSDGRGVLKAGGTLDTNGNGGFSAGAGISF